MQKCLPYGFKPDYGHIQFYQFGDIEFDIFLNHLFMWGDDIYGKMINIKTEETIITLLVTNDQFSEIYFKVTSGLHLKTRLFFQQRYQAQTGEWVLPFKIIEIQ